MYNMGETFTTVASGGSVMLTQGFEQPDIRLPIISGNPVVCVSATTNLSDTLIGGLWTSANTSVAVIGSSTGIVSGISTGTTLITYTVLGDTATITVTVNPLPQAGLINGLTSMCAVSTITLSDSVAGGTWSSSNSSVATVGSTGLVTGVAAGSANITYSCTNVCGTVVATYGVTVDPLPDAGTINGPSSLCAGSSITLSDLAAGGGWSSNTSVATITGTGVVTAVAAGTSNITYSYTNVCGTAVVTHEVTVDPLPNAGTINGISGLCAGSAVTLSDSIVGGSWSSSNTSAATIGSTGVVTGLSAGTIDVTYSYTNVCGTAVTTFGVTVDPLPVVDTISGASAICPGSSVQLFDSGAGGVWSVSNTANATVSTSGLVTGILSGVDTVRYMVSNSCGTISTEKVIPISQSGCVLSDKTSVYPNPNPGTFTIDGPSPSSGEVHIDIRDVVGQSVYKSIVTGTGGWFEEHIVLANLPDGMYIVDVTAGSSIKVFHMVIER